MITGLIFVPDDDFPNYLTVGTRKARVLMNEVEELGRYRSVSLISDISTLADQADARHVGLEAGSELVDAVERARASLSVTNPQRHAFFRTLGLRSS